MRCVHSDGCEWGMVVCTTEIRRYGNRDYGSLRHRVGRVPTIYKYKILKALSDEPIPAWLWQIGDREQRNIIAYRAASYPMIYMNRSDSVEISS